MKSLVYAFDYREACISSAYIMGECIFAGAHLCNKILAVDNDLYMW